MFSARHRISLLFIIGEDFIFITALIHLHKEAYTV